MAGIKPLDQVGKKWNRVASGAQIEYEEGVKNPRRSWAEETAKAEDSYNKGVQAGISRKAFGSGVRRAGDTKWQTNSITKGPDRYAQGIRLSENAYIEGFAPYHAALARISLPPRGPKGDPKNIERVRMVASTLHDLKVKRGA